MKRTSTDDLERKIKKKEVELITLLDEDEHLGSEQRELLNKLEWEQLLNSEKTEQGTQDSELDNKVGEAVVGISPTIKDESRIKEEKT